MLPHDRVSPIVNTGGFLGKLFKQDPSAAVRKKYTPRVEQINALEPQIKALSDEQLRAKTADFKQRVQGGESLEILLPEAFAVGRCVRNHHRACACKDL